MQLGTTRKNALSSGKVGGRGILAPVRLDKGDAKYEYMKNKKN